ncbi:MAG TPA: transglycosylase SLT domain-containing protein [Longimicrobium sp.]
MPRARTRRPPVRRTRRRAARPKLRLRAGPRLWVAVAAAVLLLALPATRHGLRDAARAVARAVADARAAEARERVVGEYARRYGIAREMADAIERAARAERVDTDLAFRLVRVESAFNPRAVSPVGAIGLTQMMLPTALELQPGITRERLFDRDTNLRLGFRYFRSLLRFYGGDVETALHAYNRGIGTVARIRAEGGDPANGYAEKVRGSVGASPVDLVPRDTTAPRPIPPRVDELAPTRLPSGT